MDPVTSTTFHQPKRVSGWPAGSAWRNGLRLPRQGLSRHLTEHVAAGSRRGPGRAVQSESRRCYQTEGRELMNCICFSFAVTSVATLRKMCRARLDARSWIRRGFCGIECDAQVTIMASCHLHIWWSQLTKLCYLIPSTAFGARSDGGRGDMSAVNTLTCRGYSSGVEPGTRVRGLTAGRRPRSCGGFLVSTHRRHTACLQAEPKATCGFSLTVCYVRRVSTSTRVFPEAFLAVLGGCRVTAAEHPETQGRLC